MHQNGKPTILVIDACESDRDACVRMLERDGHVVVHTSDGAEAITLARARLPYVILMDAQRAGLNGLETARTLRADPATARIPIIMVATPTGEDDPAAGLDAGVDEYVFKPIREREFRLRVRSMVRLREAQLEIEHTNTSLHRRNELLAKLNQFCEDVLNDHTVDSTCQRIVNTAADIMQSRRVSLLIPDAERRCLHFAHAVGIDDHLWRHLTVPLTSPIAGTVFTSAREIVVNPGDAFAGTRGQYRTEVFASVPLVCTPLRATSGPIGVLNVTEKEGTPCYDVEDIDALRQFSQTAAIALNNVQTRTQLDETRDSIIFSMAKLSEYRHQETGRHLERVTALSILLARRLARDPRIPETIDEQFISDLRRAAPLHDIGKVAIPDRILLKPKRLTDDEFSLMKAHTTTGAETLHSVISGGHDARFLRVAMDIARHHHECYDGNGYPGGLAGDAIPLAARIVCVADSYDAIRMKREYKAARPHAAAARELLRGSGTQFDPRLIQAFCAVEDEFRRIHEELAEDREEGTSGHPEPVLAGAASG